MKKLKTKLLTGVAISTLLISSFTPLALADSTVEISGNGAASSNAVSVTDNKTADVVQSNRADVTNNVTSNLTTGNNHADNNTGGSTMVATGNAVSTIDVATDVNLNRATLNPGDFNSNNQALVSGNGAGSGNAVAIDNSQTASIFQDNTANINNNIDAALHTGLNTASNNTNGNVDIITGHALSDIAVSNLANANVAEIGGQNTGSIANVNSLGEPLAARILGNGALSSNSVYLNNTHDAAIVQSNNAYLTNDILANVRTGDNNANNSTGGSVFIDTGNARSDVWVDNLANFNVAQIGDGDGTLLGKISGNGFDSSSAIAADSSRVLSVFQGGEGFGNDFILDNPIDANVASGYNSASGSTASFISSLGGLDPVVVITGHALSDTAVSNRGNVNSFSSYGGSILPSNLLFDFNFDLSGLTGLLHSLS